jgi:hypothetical protein
VIFLASTTLPIALLLNLVGNVKYAKQSAAEEQGKEERDNEAGSDPKSVSAYNEDDKETTEVLRSEDIEGEEHAGTAMVDAFLPMAASVDDTGSSKDRLDWHSPSITSPDDSYTPTCS